MDYIALDNNGGGGVRVRSGIDQSESTMSSSMRTRVWLVAIAAVLLAAGCSGVNGRAGSTTSHPVSDSQEIALDVAEGAISRNGRIPDFNDPLAIDNPYLPFARRGVWIYEGTKNGEPYRIEVEVTAETEIVAWRDAEGLHETETMVVRHRGWVKDELIEEAMDYFAQGDDGAVWYFGEEVDNYEGGEIVDHDGSWLAGADGALPALLMPAEPEVGQVFYSEDIVGLDIVEVDEILALDVEAETPDGRVDNGLLLGAVRPDGTQEEKIFVPDVGEVLARSDDGEVSLVAWTPQGDGPAYQPDIDPSLFATEVDNEYLPLRAGSEWRYEVKTAEGSVDTLNMVVADETRTILGIETTIVTVTLTVDGKAEEVTESWYAQDNTGAVWLFGEIDEGYEDSELVETTTWEAGVDEAQPGVVMLGAAAIGETYRTGYVAGVVEEQARLAAANVSVSTPAGDFTDVWVVESWSDLEPGVVERKHYAPGIGLVLAVSVSADTDVVELVSASLAPLIQPTATDSGVNEVLFCDSGQVGVRRLLAQFQYTRLQYTRRSCWYWSALKRASSAACGLSHSAVPGDLWSSRPRSTGSPAAGPTRPRVGSAADDLSESRPSRSQRGLTDGNGRASCLPSD